MASVFAVLLLAAATLRAQIVNDGATNTLSNITNTFTGDVTVGTNGSFTLLILSDNALLTNSVNGLIGRNTGANSNEVRLASASARWLMGGSLFVGTNGAANRLVVSNGATVLAGNFSTLGYGGSANSNTVTVSGAGSLWSNGLDLIVGEVGSANRLEVNNGGRVLNNNAFVGRSIFSPSNTVVVTGAGSLWSNRADVSLGGVGSGNLLVVSNGGWVVNSNASVGASSFGNLAWVTGPNSTWSNRADLFVGNGARGNQLVVSDGALVVDNNGVLGKSVTSSNNLALVTGGGSLWSNRNNLDIGSFGRDNQMIVSNGGWVASRTVRVGVDASSSNNFVLVSGSGSVWSNVTSLSVGNIAPGNRLVIEAGGLVHCDAGTVGDFNSASNNEALVTGPGSLWTNRSTLTIGSQMPGNRLVVSNGATVWSGTGSVGSRSNQVVVTGTGSVWSNQTFLFIGGGSNRVEVSDGGWLACNDGYVGAAFSANSNMVTLRDGAGWNNLGNFFVGDGGSGNVLIASNGATVLSSNAFIGASTSLGNNNFALLTGAGTIWSNRSDLKIGNFSVGNRLVISNGATFSVGGSGFVGANPGANSNSVTVTGSGSVWSNSDSLYVGYAGPANRMVISNGGVAQCIFGELGNLTGSDSNVVQVTDAGSIWNSSILYVGLRGRGNRLLVTNGGLVSSELSSIGNQVSANGNEVVVTGAGSVWSNRLVEVGSLGSGNQLTITNGGAVFVVDTNSTSTSLVIGASLSATNSRVTVNGGTLRVMGTNGTGRLDVRRGTNLFSAGLMDVDQLLVTNNQGRFEFNGGTLITRGAFITNVPFAMGFAGFAPALWAVRAGASHVLTVPLSLGQSSPFNQLLVTNGGTLSSMGGFIGLTSGARSNAAVVAGPGSTWAVDSSILEIGSGGPFNSLVVSNGGLLRDNLAYFGSSAGSNLALVTGTGSVWSNASELHIGAGSAGNQVIVSAGGAVRSAFAYLGDSFTASNNLALVTGAGSVWSNVNDLFCGADGARNQLVVSNGALIWAGVAHLGLQPRSSNNVALVTGVGSVLSNIAINVGRAGSGNQLLVRDGGAARSSSVLVGAETQGSNNVVWVTDPGSVLEGELFVGFDGSRNQLVVSNGAVARSDFGFVGLNSTSSNNLVLVTGPGSIWSNRFDCYVGNSAPSNRLAVSDGGLVAVSSNVIVGVNASSVSNLVTVDGGTLRAVNPAGNGTLEVRRGNLVLNAGQIEVDQLLLPSMVGRFNFNGGLLSVKQSSSIHIFQVGNGVSPATFHLAGNGSHSFGGLGVFVGSNAIVTGNGTISSSLRILNGGTLSPGTSVGRIVLNSPPSLLGTTLMELAKTGSTRTNDQLQVLGPLTYGGSLAVNHLGPTALRIGDRFRLFDAASYAGAFTSLSLPPLSPGLGWINRLLEDGSIEVAFISVTTTNVPVRVMAANLTSGNNQRYETSGLNILQGLKPDIVAIQEFNVSNVFGLNTPAALSNMVATTFGPGFFFSRETNAGYTIPNGIISRYPILASGQWIDSDTGVNDRGFVWAQIDLPGTNDLYLVSVHLKASSGATNETRRAAEAAELKDLITTNFPAGAWIIVAGDMNLFSETEPAILTLTTLLADSPVPADQNGDPDTNAGRTQRYDRVLSSFSLTNRLVPLVMPSRTYTNGLVFDSRIYTPLAEVPPVQSGDSAAPNMQHMAVMKLLEIPVSITNTLPGLGREYGVDVSHFQNEAGVSQTAWDQMFAEGQRFAFIKATEGLTGPHDPTMSNNVARAVAAGLLAGVYHFAHPENRPTTNGAVLEASNFVVYADSAIGPGRLRPVLDLERGSNLTTTELTDWVIAFCDEVIARRGPGATPIIYCSQTFANSELDSRLAGYDLWLRTVNSGADPDLDDPPAQVGFTNATGIFTNWAFWQFSATGSSGGISPIDLNVCHSETKPLISFVIPAPPPPPTIQAGSLALTGGGFQFGFTSAPSETFTILASPDPALPVSNWTVLGTVIETAPGQYHFTDPQATNQPRRFYQMRWP